MKQEWKPDEMRANAEEIREAIMPKSVTPEMVGGTLLGLVEAINDLMPMVPATFELLCVKLFEDLEEGNALSEWVFCGEGGTTNILESGIKVGDNVIIKQGNTLANDHDSDTDADSYPMVQGFVVQKNSADDFDVDVFYDGDYVRLHFLNGGSVEINRLAIPAKLPYYESVVNMHKEKQSALNSSADIIVSDSTLSLSELAKRRVFIDMWNDACGEYGTYNPETGFFELNEITDIGYDEAIRILSVGYKYIHNGMSGNFSNVLNSNLNIRTALPLIAPLGGGSVKLDNVANTNNNIRVIRYVGYYQRTISTLDGAFNNSGVTRVLGVLNLASNCTFKDSFRYCYNLESIQLKGLASSIDIRFCHKITLESLQYMVSNADNTKTITITLHSSVYAKITGDEGHEAYNSLTEEEKEQWTALAPLALNKNISFATV